MVNYIKLRVVVGILLTATLFYGNSQNSEIFQDYKKWGIFISPISFKKASISRVGNTILNNKNITSFQLGIKYHFLMIKLLVLILV